MTSAALILLARALHIVGGVVWAGALFVVATTVLPIAKQHAADGADRWAALVARRVGPLSGVGAILTVLSGIYLLMVLHPHDTSINGRVLQAGAAAGILSFAVGFFVGRPTAMKLSRLAEQAKGAAAGEIAEQMAVLRKRSAVSMQFTVALLFLAILAMALFRFVHLLA